MLLTVPSIVRRVAPELVRDRAVSVARIRTTRPIYLAFVPDSEWPVSALQFGTRDELLPLHEVMSALHPLVPDLVPDALACEPVSASTWVLVQEGLPGTPWFRLRERLRSIGDWLALRGRAAAALRRLHGAIEGCGRFRVGVDIAGEMRLQLRRYVERYGGAREVVDRVEAIVASLGPLPPRPAFWQHGDYCLNNVLVDEDRLGIIDFEEFGRTAVPLHDEFGLALSCDHFMRDLRGAPTLADQVRACVAPALAERQDLLPHVDALFVHHLLWRVNQCADRPTRKAIGDELTALLLDTLRRPAPACGAFTLSRGADDAPIRPVPLALRAAPYA